MAKSTDTPQLSSDEATCLGGLVPSMFRALEDMLGCVFLLLAAGAYGRITCPNSVQETIEKGAEA